MIIPKTVNDLVGKNQKLACKVLLESIENNTLSHTVIFYGQTGIGKTSVADIVGDKLTIHKTDINCKTVNLAEIQKIVGLLLSYPSYDGLPKLLFLDEIQELTAIQQRTLFKSLEKMPEHAYVFSATDQPDKIIPAIRDRFDPYWFHTPTEPEIKNWLLETGLNNYGIGLHSPPTKKVIDEWLVENNLTEYTPGQHPQDKILLDNPVFVTVDQINQTILNANGSMRALHWQLKKIQQGFGVEGYVEELETNFPQTVLSGNLRNIMSELNDYKISELSGLATGLVNYCLRAMTPESQAVIKSFGSGDLSSPLVKGDFVCKLLKALDNYPKRG